MLFLGNQKKNVNISRKSSCSNKRLTSIATSIQFTDRKNAVHSAIVQAFFTFIVLAILCDAVRKRKLYAQLYKKIYTFR